MSQHKANLDAWYVLRTVIDAGGFAQAADQLQRSQSAVSYSISKLQEQIGLELLTIKGRRAVLTGHGALLLERTRALLAEYDELLLLASELRKGKEPGLSVWIDGICPTWFLKPVLGEFQTHFPSTDISIAQGWIKLKTGDNELEQTDLAITTSPIWETGCDNLGELTFIAVAHPNHPLLGCDPPLNQLVLEKHRQVRLRESCLDKGQEDIFEQNESTWFVSDLHQAIDAVLIGQAYGWLPEEIIEQELREGKLRRLELEQGQRYRLPVYLQYNPHRSSGPARQSLGKLIRQYFTSSQSY